MKRIIKNFEFTDVERPDIFLSDVTKIRINAEDTLNSVLQLKAISMGKFSLDTDIFARLPLTTPAAIKQWQKFEVIGTFPTGTSARFRLNNGTREIYWDGGAWVTAGAADWSTEVEINDNLPTFPFDNRSFGVIINLLTTDETVTPEIKEVKVLGLFDYNIYKDVMVTLLRALFEKVRPTSTLLTDVVTTTSSFDLASDDYKLQNQGYNILDVTAIYNTTDDPLKITNLRTGYTPGAINQDEQTNAPGVATTSSPIAAGKEVEIVFQYVPEVAFHTDEDYFEVGKVPSIAIESMEEMYLSLQPFATVR